MAEENGDVRIFPATEGIQERERERQRAKGRLIEAYRQNDREEDRERET